MVILARRENSRNRFQDDGRDGTAPTPALEVIQGRTRKIACATCGRQVERRARQQLYCSARCQERARYRLRGRGSRAAKINAVRPFLPGDPPKKLHDFNGRPLLTDTRSSSRLVGPARVLQVELFDRAWRAAVSSDGVPIEVGRLRQRALVGQRETAPIR